MILGVVYLLQGNPSAAPMAADHLIPQWTGIASLVLIVNNFLSYSGMEMNSVHVASLKNPKKEFPKAMFFAMGLVLLIFILPALAISWVVPAQQLSLTAGVMQAFSEFFGYFGIERLVPIVAIALVCASAGGMLTWLAGPSKGLLLIARREGFLPPFFQQQNENEVAIHILVVQGAVTTVIALMYALIPSVSSAYWILSVMTTQVYLIVYLLMFVAAVNLRKRQPNVERGYTAPALKFLCVVGFLASAAAILIGFVPPSQFENGSTGAYVGLILAGTVLLGLLPPWLFLKFRKPSWKSDGGVVMSAAARPETPQGARKPPHDVHRHRRRGRRPGHRSALILYDAAQDNQEAQAKAEQLMQAFERAGLPVPADTDQIVATLGDDGGAVCANPANALGKATLLDQISQRRVVRRPPAGDLRSPVRGRRGADPADLLPGRVAGLPGEDRRTEVRRHHQALMAAGAPGSAGRQGRPRGRVRVGARREREHVGGDDPAALDQRGRRRAGRRAAVGGDGLLARRRGGDRDLGRARRRVRPAQALPRRAGAVHRLVRADRAVDLRRRRHRRPDDPGRLGRDDPRVRHEPAVRRRVRARADEGDHALGRRIRRGRRRSARWWAACSSTPPAGRGCSGSTPRSPPRASR